MTLSIVIIHYRSWASLARCLEALGPPVPGEPATPGAAAEVVVVDNSDDASAASERANVAARFPTARFIHHPDNRGYSSACNRGAEAASGELLLFLNADVEATRAGVDALVEEKLRHPEVALLAPRQVTKDGRPTKAFDVFPSLLTSFGWFRALKRILDPARHPDPRGAHRELVHCDWISGSAVLVAASDLCEIGGWNERFWLYFEDVDLCHRAHDRGHATAYTPAATFIHSHGASTRRDESTSALTKSETIISRHVYGTLHFEGLSEAAFHGIVVTKTIVPLLFYTILDTVTLRSVRTLRRRSAMLRAMLGYYARVYETGTWISPRSPLYPDVAGATR